MNDRIYLDHASTTAVAPEVLEAMMPYFTQMYGNPSSVHGFGRETASAVSKARKQVASAIGAEAGEIFFTACGSESDNWAIKGAALAAGNGGKHIITTAIEHHAVLHTCAWLEKQGFEVTYLPVDQDGLVDPESVRAAIRQDTVLVSVMMANNEIGTVEPIAEIGRITHEKGILFHSDAVQAVGSLPIDVNELQVDMLSISGHKFNGPKGVGVLYVRKGCRVDPLIHGGAQERGLRAGTENVPGIIGIGKAIEMATTDMDAKVACLTARRDRLIRGLTEALPYAKLNGHPEKRLPNNINLSFEGVEGEALLLRLDLAGIAASGGSACTSGSVDPSHVLMATGLTEAEANGSIRLTLGSENTDAEIDRVLTVLPEIVRDLRRMTGRE